VSASTSTIGGRRVYFGTDGRLFATTAWRSNAAAIQVEAAGRGKPLALKPQLMAIVGKLP
jgi:hypothetical protein